MQCRFREEFGRFETEEVASRQAFRGGIHSSVGGAGVGIVGVRGVVVSCVGGGEVVGGGHEGGVILGSEVPRVEGGGGHDGSVYVKEQSAFLKLPPECKKVADRLFYC